MSALLMHAVAAAGDDGRAFAEHGRLFSWIDADGLCALVSAPEAAEADETLFADPEAVARLAMLHHAVLTRLARENDIVPVTLGAVFSGPEAVRHRLAVGAGAFRDALGRIAGGAEFSVKLLAEAAADPAPAAAETGRGYLAALKARKEAVRTDALARARFTLELRQALSGAAIRLRERPARPDPARRCLIDLACLAPRGSEALAASLAAALAPRAALLGLSLRIDGPWPPYSFIAEAA
jgi:hypothetical protein